MDKLTISWTNTALKKKNLISEYWDKQNWKTKFSAKILEQINFRTNHLIDFPKLEKKQISRIQEQSLSVIILFSFGTIE